MSCTINIALQEIFSYIKDRKRPMVEGEAVFKAGHVLSCKISNVGDHCVVGYVLQTTGISKTPHEVQLNLKGEWKCKCSCKAGLSGYCKHIVACLLYINSHENLEVQSCTEVRQSWGKVKTLVTEQYSAATSEQLCSKRTKRNFPPLPPSSPEQDAKNLSLFVRSKKTSAISIFMQRASHQATLQRTDDLTQTRATEPTTSTNDVDAYDPENPPPQPLPEPFIQSIPGPSTLPLHITPAPSSEFRYSDLSILDSIIFEHTLPKCCSRVMEQLSLDANNGALFNLLQGSQEWQRLRSVRITGSRCYQIFTYAKNDWVQKAIDYLWPKTFSNKCTKYGKATERTALECFIKLNSGLNIHHPGFIIPPKHPWVGYSPDAVISEQGHLTGLIEIKCPYVGRTCSAEELLDKCPYLEFKNGVINLKKRHAYYGQVQFGMALLNVQKTIFLVYSSKSNSNLEIIVDFDEEFAKKMLIKCAENYFSYILPMYCYFVTDNHEI